MLGRKGVSPCQFRFCVGYGSVYWIGTFLVAVSLLNSRDCNIPTEASSKKFGEGGLWFWRQTSEEKGYSETTHLLKDFAPFIPSIEMQIAILQQWVYPCEVTFFYHFMILFLFYHLTIISHHEAISVE